MHCSPLSAFTFGLAVFFTLAARGQAQDLQTEQPAKPASKRMHKYTDEELRKQLLAASEIGLDQNAAAVLYKFLKEVNAVGGEKKAQELPPDAGPRFLEKIAAQMGRPDFLALPWRPVIEAQMGKEPAELFHVLSIELRNMVRESVPNRDVRPDPVQLRKFFESGLVQPGGGFGGKGEAVKPEDWTKPQAVPVLVQMLQVENSPIRLLLVERLKDVKGKEASLALVQRAVYDLSTEVRDKAVSALADRPLAEYRDPLLGALRNPWPAAAEHAAETIIALKLNGLAPDLVNLLKLQDPSRPFTVKIRGREVLVVREMVRINHMCNCVLCHAPSFNKEDLVRGRAPMPGEDPPPVYYKGDQGGQFVRAEVTFLRQDFSVVQPVAVPGKWPGQQRYDYLVRERPLTDPEIKAFVRLKDDKTPQAFVQRDAVLFALRELTQRDAGKDYADWTQLLERMAVEQKK